MKNIVALFLFLFLLSLEYNAAAQQSSAYRLIKMVDVGYNATGLPRDTFHNTNYFYHSGTLYYEVVDSARFAGERDIYSYDDSERVLIEYSQTKNPNTGIWTDQVLSTYSYSRNQSKQLKETSVNGHWMLAEQKEAYKSTQGLDTFRNNDYYFNGKYSSSNFSTFYFNKDRKISLVLVTFKDSQGLLARNKDTFIYNSSGQLIQTTYYSEPHGNIMEQYYYTYNADGSLFEVMDVTWDTWRNRAFLWSKTRYYYNTNHQEIIDTTFNLTSGKWKENSHNVSTWDNNGNMLTKSNFTLTTQPAKYNKETYFYFYEPIPVPAPPVTTLRCYPVPAENSLTIDIPGTDNHFSLYMHDITGRTVESRNDLSSSGNKLQLDISRLRNGMYLGELISASGWRWSFRVVKN
jgi:hypothetical protein